MAGNGARVVVFGGTGTIGQAVVRRLVREGHAPVCALRAAPQGPLAALAQAGRITLRIADVTDPAALAAQVFAHDRFDAVISCLASRGGAPADAWAIDHGAQRAILTAAQDAGAGRFILLSALCVQKPRLAFQHAKLAFEADLAASGLHYSIVRPTAFFKSLSGQMRRVRAGKPFLVFGDGRLTACKPISDDDLARFLTGCLADPARTDRVLPVGGPGPALTPLDQGRALCAALDRPAVFRHVPVRMLDAIIATLALAGRISPRAAAKADLARIGRYYATESMLLLNPATGCHDADITPEFGSGTLPEFYRALAAGRTNVDLGDHAVF